MNAIPQRCWRPLSVLCRSYDMVVLVSINRNIFAREYRSTLAMWQSDGDERPQTGATHINLCRTGLKHVMTIDVFLVVYSQHSPSNWLLMSSFLRPSFSPTIHTRSVASFVFVRLQSTYYMTSGNVCVRAVAECWNKKYTLHYTRMRWLSLRFQFYFWASSCYKSERVISETTAPEDALLPRDFTLPSRRSYIGRNYSGPWSFYVATWPTTRSCLRMSVLCNENGCCWITAAHTPGFVVLFAFPSDIFPFLILHFYPYQVLLDERPP